MAACLTIKHIKVGATSVISPDIPSINVEKYVPTVITENCLEIKPDAEVYICEREITAPEVHIPKVEHPQLSIRVSLFDEENFTRNPKINVRVTNMNKGVKVKTEKTKFVVKTVQNLSIQKVSLFCPIDLIKSCFGSGHWIEYRPWLLNEGWKYHKEK